MLVPVLCFTLVLAACAVVIVRAFGPLGGQLSRTGAELERLSDRLETRFLPDVERVVAQATVVGHDLEAIADASAATARRFDEVIATLGDVTLMVEESVRSVADVAAAVGVDRRRTGAVRAAIHAFLGRLLQHRR